MSVASKMETKSLSSRRIFFLATDTHVPSGGRLFIYHLVDLLSSNGFQAYALHQQRNFRYSWFENSTPVRWTHQIKRARIKTIKHAVRFYIDRIQEVWTATQIHTERVEVGPKDIIVVPESRASSIHKIFPGIPKILLSQGPYVLFQSEALQNPEQSIHHPDVKACITMSKLNYEMHCLVSPLNTWNATCFVDPTLYSYTEKKKPQIAYMPRRLKEDSTALINLLNMRGHMHDFTFVPIDNMSQQQAAQVMKESLIFLSFSHRDGLGLPPAEAMACGCIVIGYSGNGGDEFFDESTAFKIASGDLVSYVKTVERIIAEYIIAPAALDQFRLRASQYILRTYSRERARDCFLSAWNGAMEVIADL